MARMVWSINHSMLLLPKNFSDVIFHSLPQKWWTLDNKKKKEEENQMREKRWETLRMFDSEASAVTWQLWLELFVPELCLFRSVIAPGLLMQVEKEGDSVDGLDGQGMYSMPLDVMTRVINKTHGFEKQFCFCKVSGSLRIGLQTACCTYQLY